MALVGFSGVLRVVQEENEEDLYESHSWEIHKERIPKENSEMSGSFEAFLGQG